VDAFNKAIILQKLDKKIATLKENDPTITGLESSRPLIRAAFTADKGKILVNNEGSSIFEFGNKFVIGSLVEATEEGSASFEAAKTEVELVVRKNKRCCRCKLYFLFGSITWIRTCSNWNSGYPF
jgi:peptidyl-prolyl cis-trans isomerase D